MLSSSGVSAAAAAKTTYLPLEEMSALKLGRGTYPPSEENAIRSVTPVCRSCTKTSSAPSPPVGSTSPATKFEASELNATNRPFRKTAGSKLAPFPILPDVLALTSSVVPSRRSRTNTSNWWLSSPGTRFGAFEANATNRPSPLNRRHRAVPGALFLVVGHTHASRHGLVAGDAARRPLVGRTPRGGDRKQRRHDRRRGHHPSPGPVHVEPLVAVSLSPTLDGGAQSRNPIGPALPLWALRVRTPDLRLVRARRISAGQSVDLRRELLPFRGRFESLHEEREEGPEETRGERGPRLP